VPILLNVVASLAKIPTVFSRSVALRTPVRSTAVCVGRFPKSPFTPAGCLMEPPVSVPIVQSSQGYAAAATALPVLEDDGLCSPSPRGFIGQVEPIHW
jgi:hypothetical protein